MPVLYVNNRPDIVLSQSGSTFSNGLVGHPLQKAGVIAYATHLPQKFAPFRGVGASLQHALQNFAIRGGMEGSGTIF